MIKLGEIKKTRDDHYPQVWLCKDLALERAGIPAYTVMILRAQSEGGGWFTAFNGSLKQAREYAEAQI